ncbi:MAG: 30S ribosomal protein S6 [Patescibacteria group bacterium]|nr:30S ribosomal protein S6 [Patescibacteria group bacterium]MDE2014991.1 30S ribosomal protein S6 [Patescibacteria group bacterium]MDE2226420.1 30S ribosomal protein S6 [Patescibacteria group bacterium]
MDTNQKQEADKKSYELSFLVQKEEAAADILRLMGQHSVEAGPISPIKKISLAYKIKHLDSANFGFVHVSAYPSDIKLLEHDLSTNAEVLRFLIISLPKRQIMSEQSRSPRKPIIRKTVRPAAPSEPKTLSNEILEQKIEEILK